METLEERQLMDASVAAADWWRNVLCQNPPDSALAGDEDGGASTFGQGGMPTIGLTQGWATFGQVFPQGAAYDAVQVGDLATQTDVKTRWNDGSIRHAVITAYAPEGGTYTLTAAADARDTMTPTMPYTAILFWMYDSWFYAVADETDWSDRWLDGDLVTEARQTLTVHHWPSGDLYPNLQVTTDVRSYVDGQVRTDITVENTLDLPGTGMEHYSLLVFQDGELVSARENISHPYLTRWRQVIASGTPQARVTPDFEPAYAAQALPRYWQGVQNRIYGPGGPNFEPLGPGALNPFMPSHGGREELGPYPDWAARYLVHKDPTQESFVLAHGDLAGSWPVHVRNEDGSMVRINERPDFWLDMPNNRGIDQPRGNLYAVGPLQPDNAHVPSLAYIPYLVTGDRYYADEMAFWANYAMMSTIPGFRGGTGGDGLLWSNETRGFAWTLRNLVDAAAYLPDDYPLKAYFLERVNNNLAWLTNHANTQVGPLGIAWHRSPFDNGDNPYFDPERRHVWQSTAQNNYLAWSVDHANKQGFTGGENFKDQVARFNVALLTNPNTRDGAAPYYTPIGDRQTDGTVNWYTQLEQTYRGPTQYAGFYGPDARLMCIIGMETGIAGAQQAYDYLEPELMVRPNVDLIPDLALRGGWSQMPEMAV